MVEIISAKLISYVKVDFSTEAEMDLYINMFEKEGENFYKQLKQVGLLRWRFNRVWNKNGGFEVAQIFEYKDEKAYIKGQELIAKLMSGNKSFFQKINLKRTASRSINLLDFYDSQEIIHSYSSLILLNGRGSFFNFLY